MVIQLQIHLYALFCLILFDFSLFCPILLFSLVLFPLAYSVDRGSALSFPSIPYLLCFFPGVIACYPPGDVIC